jgi:pantoate--beta-alanine ligase
MSVPEQVRTSFLIDSVEDLASTRDRLSAQGRDVVLVPTMGALHEGHRTLIRTARGLGDAVIVTIFVNPLQFLPSEDFDKYPRQLEADLEACAAEGADHVFAPPRSAVYPDEPVVTVSSGSMGALLDGRTRPGHFDGMLTVVLKLFNLVRPHVAVFGEKDGQQLALIRRMVSDLNVPVRIEGVPTVRDPDGIAISSRNAYLSAAERDSALALSRALFAGRDSASGGRDAVLRAGRDVLEKAATAVPPVDGEYFTLVSPDTWEEVSRDMTGPAVLAVAARVGDTRLIDNVPLILGSN